MRLLDKSGNCSLSVHTVKYTGWSKLCIFQQKRVTNLIISQHCLHFKYMKVSILGKCIIKIPDLQKVWYYTGCAQLNYSAK